VTGAAPRGRDFAAGARARLIGREPHATDGPRYPRGRANATDCERGGTTVREGGRSHGLRPRAPFGSMSLRNQRAAVRRQREKDLHRVRPRVRTTRSTARCPRQRPSSSGRARSHRPNGPSIRGAAGRGGTTHTRRRARRHVLRYSFATHSIESRTGTRRKSRGPPAPKPERGRTPGLSARAHRDADRDRRGRAHRAAVRSGEHRLRRRDRVPTAATGRARRPDPHRAQADRAAAAPALRRNDRLGAPPGHGPLPGTERDDPQTLAGPNSISSKATPSRRASPSFALFAPAVTVVTFGTRVGTTTTP